MPLPLDLGLKHFLHVGAELPPSGKDPKVPGIRVSVDVSTSLTNQSVSWRVYKLPIYSYVSIYLSIYLTTLGTQ